MNLATAELEPLSKFLGKFGDYFEVARKTEGRVSSDTDLKLSDTLRYYTRDSKAALDLLYRRSRRLADYETENKNLEKARQKHKDEKQAETNQQLAKEKFEAISKIARNGKLTTLTIHRLTTTATLDQQFSHPISELTDFKTRRIAMFKKSLTEFVEFQLKHSNVTASQKPGTFISNPLSSNHFNFKAQVTQIKNLLDTLAD